MTGTDAIRYRICTVNKIELSNILDTDKGNRSIIAFDQISKTSSSLFF